MSGKKKKNTNTLVIVLICVVLILVTGAACLLFFTNKSAEKKEQYNQKKTEAEKYIRKEKYDKAIKCYEELIQMDKENAEAYYQLAEIYIVHTQEPEEALDVYNLGYRNTGSDLLFQKYEDLLKDLTKETESESESETDVITDLMGTDETPQVPDISFDPAKQAKDTKGPQLMKALSTYTDSRYVADYGSHKINEKVQEDMIRVRYEKLAADIYYRNDENGNTFSDVDNMPFSASHPFRAVLDNIRNIFGMDSDIAITYDDIAYMLGTRPEISGTAVKGKTVLVIPYFSCMIYVECDEKGNLASGQVWNQIELPVQAKQQEDKLYYGMIMNAVDGSGIEGASVTLVSPDGDAYEGVTDAEGYYEIEGAPAGENYQLTVEKDGFITEEREMELPEDEMDLGIVSCSPVLDNKEMRIILEWGEEPYDLDSYYIGEYNDGTSVEVYFEHMADSRNGELAVSLDRDDRDGFGPETTTVRGLDGSFMYCVHDYMQTGMMGEISNAVVKVYLPDGTVNTYTIPSGAGNLWKVFSVVNGEITEIGTIE